MGAGRPVLPMWGRRRRAPPYDILRMCAVMKTKKPIPSPPARARSYLLRWIASFGQCPSPVRDDGLRAWTYLHRQRAADGAAPLGALLADDPFLSVGMDG